MTTNHVKKAQTIAVKRQNSNSPELVFTASMSSAEVRKAQRRAQAGELDKLRDGIFISAGLTEEEKVQLIRSNWQKLAGTVAPGGVISHISAMTKGVQNDFSLYVSHPTNNNKKVVLPGLVIHLLRGPGPLPMDLQLGSTGLSWASRSRFLLENVGKLAPKRAGREFVEQFLINVLNSAGEQALNEIRDQVVSLSPLLGMDKEAALLRSIIGALLGTHSKGELRTVAGKLVANGTPLDQGRMTRFEILAAHLRTTVLPHIQDNVNAGISRHNLSFVESYFSNYVEGTKFEINEARDIVLNNAVVSTRPKDSHDILGVFRLSITQPYRDSPPTAGSDFLIGLQSWHAEMLKMRPEVNPGRLKLENNYAGTTEFVSPELVRGTMAEGSKLALSVPEGLARAIYYAFLISEVHPFDDGNGRLSRLVMNSELTRVGLHRVIIPTLFHPEYVDCARSLTRKNDPEGFVQSISKMAVWCSQFDFSDLDEVIRGLKATNALEESPVNYKLLNLNK